MSFIYLLYALGTILFLTCIASIYLFYSIKITTDQNDVPKGSIVITDNKIIWGFYGLETMTAILSAGICITAFMGKF